MLSKSRKFFLLVALLSLIGCSAMGEKSCINTFNKRIYILTADKQVVDAINRIDRNIFCGAGVYKDFYINVDYFINGLDDKQKLEFYTTLLFAEFHKNQNGGEYIDFLRGNKINIYNQYLNKIGDKELLKEMNYSDEYLSNIKILGEAFK